MRIWHQGGARLFEYSYGQFTADRREVIKKYFQGITGFKMIEECLDWHSRASEDGCSTQKLWVDGDQVSIHARTPGGLLTQV
jgi:hypothetical protein